MTPKKTLCAVAIAAAATSAHAVPFGTSTDAMMDGVNGVTTQVLFTIGETWAEGTANAYSPVGILDGIGAYALNDDTVRVLVNHELSSGQGAEYALANGTRHQGARVSYIDIDKNGRHVVDAGLAYDTAFGRDYNPIATDTSGYNRLCSSKFVKAGDFGFVDNLYFTGEETGGGTEYVVDADNRAIHAAPAMGVAGWENVTPLATGNANKVALLVGDDRAGQAAMLYVGDKDAVGDGSFLDRNGLKQGKLYAWVSDTGETAPSQFNTAGSLNGSWVEIDNRQDGVNDGAAGDYDGDGWATQGYLDGQKTAVGAFQFSRPEDVATDPNDGTRAVMASTGRDSIDGGADSWGTVYIFDVDFDANGDPSGTSVEIAYDGDADPNRTLRSPDNLDWDDAGNVVLQEDRSTDWSAETREASILRMLGATGAPSLLAVMDRAAVPAGQTDTDPGDLGDWESSGILDVSSLFGEDVGSLFLFDVQAHSLRGGQIDALNLVQGGQLLFLDVGSNAVPVVPTALLLLAGMPLLRRRK